MEQFVLYMVERFLKLFEFINRINYSLPNAPPLLNLDEISVLDDTINLMPYMEKLCSEISSEQLITSSKILPMIFLLKENIRKVEKKTLSGGLLKKNLIAEIETRFKDFEKVN